MLALYRSLSLRYWQRRTARVLLVLASIALGVATWAATRTLGQNLDAAVRQAATPLGGADDLYVSNGDAGTQVDLVEPLRGVPGVCRVRPLVVQRVVLPDLGHRTALLLGIDLPPAQEEDPGWPVRVQERSPSASFGALFLARKPVLVGEELDRTLPADAAVLTVLAAGRAHRLTRAGTIGGAGPAAVLGGNVLVLRCADAAGLFGWTDRVSRIGVALEPGADRTAVRGRFEAVLQGRASVWTPEGHDGRVQDMLAGIQVALALCAVGALVVSTFLVCNTLAVAVAERRHDIGILRSVGATRGQVGALFLGEAAVLGLAGSLAGLPLGVGLARLALGPAQQALGDVFVALPGQSLQIAAEPLAGALFAGVAAAVLAGCLPALRAARESPIDALRRVPPAVGGRHRLGALAALGLTAAGLLLAGLSDRLPRRLGTCGGLVLLCLAALLATPALAGLLARLLHPLTALFGVGSRLALDNVRRAPGRTGLVVAALAAGVALLVLTAGMVRSNEDAVRTWVDQSIAGDLFVTSGGPLSASGRTLPMGADALDCLHEVLPEARVVAMRFRHLDWQQAGRPERVLVVALDAAAYYEANQEHQPPLPDLDLYRRLPEAGTVLVSENFAALHGTRPGDTITLPGLDGPVPLRVLGTVADYSCNRGTVLLDRAQFRRQFDAGLIDVLDIYLPAGADVEAARQCLLRSPAAAERDLCVLTRDELRGHVLGMVRRLYGLAYGQEAVVAMVAVLGVVSAMVIAVLQRRRELGLLRAIGATRGQVLRWVVAEAALLGGLGTAVGLALGWPLECYTVRVLLLEESGFAFPVRFPWLAAGAVAGLAMAGAALAGLGPALGAGHASIPAAIAHE